MRSRLASLGVAVSLCLIGCKAEYSQTNRLTGDEAWACIHHGEQAESCIDKSLDLIGYVGDYDDGEWEIHKEPDGDKVFIALGGVLAFQEGTKVLVRGLVTEGSFFASDTTIKVRDSKVLAPAPKPEPTAEEIIARNREMGRRALEEADEVIRKNNQDLRTALAAKAVTHHVSNSHGLRVDVYGMPDGRHIGCKTVVSDVGPPITTCDGEP